MSDLKRDSTSTRLHNNKTRPTFTLSYKMLANVLAVCLLSVAVVYAKNGGSKPSLIKDLGYQRIQGRNNGTLDLYLGFRYASAERFQLPHTPEENRSSIIPATELGTYCWQAGGGALPGAEPTSYPPGTEDCLLMNIVVPANATEKSKLPVVFYIHGGGFHNGGIDGSLGNSGAGIPNFDMVRRYPKYIYVEIQYRLGAFGFLGSEEVKNGGKLNLGLYDQQYALQWVQEHIHKFGGDPRRVTLWGHSAGGGSILSHAVANNGSTQAALGLKHPLFYAILPNSAFEQLNTSPTSAGPTSAYKALVQATNCTDAADTLQCLTAVEEAVYADAAARVAAGQYPNSFIWTPTVDGSLIVDAPAKLLSQGLVNTDRIFGISDLNEGIPFPPATLLNVNADAELDDFIRGWLPGSSNEVISRIKSKYPEEDFPSGNNTYLRAATIFTDSLFRCTTYRLSRSAKKVGYGSTFSVFPALHTQDYIVSWDGFVVQPLPLVNNFVGSLYGWLVHGDPNKNPLSSDGPSWAKIGDGKEVVFDVQRASNSESNPYNLTQVLEGTFALLSDPTFSALAATYASPVNFSTVDTEPLYLDSKCDFWSELYLAQRF